MTTTQRSINFDEAVQPFCRNSDPRTSEQAAKTRSRKVQPIHYFVLRHHLEHKDSDRNAGFAAVAAGLTLDWEHGRRASRSIREDLNWIEPMLDDDGQPAVVKNYGTNKFAARNRITEEGSAALMSQPIPLAQ